MKTPLIVVNFKAYREGLGREGLKLAQLCEKMSWDTGQAIAIAPPMTELALMCQQVKIPVLAQHCNNLPAGNFTGWVPVEAVRTSGATGSILNHSERRLELSDLGALIERCETFGLETVVCADNLPVARACAALGPTFVAIEPPELIGGDVSVTTAEPEVVSGTLKAIRKIDPEVKVLCGAGVKTGEDVHLALKLGTQGVLVSSGVVRAKKPAEALEDLLSGLGK